MNLGVVESNTKAVRLYEKFGFVEIRAPKSTKIALVKQRFEPTADFLYS